MKGSPSASVFRLHATLPALAWVVIAGGCARWGYDHLNPDLRDPDDGGVPRAPTSRDAATNARADAGDGGGAPTCSDGLQNGSETGLDCGGLCPLACSPDALCEAGSCANDSCDGGGCESCQDGAQNQTETDIDCGGGACAPCPDDARCNVPSDCAGELCEGNVCSSPTCSDGILNQNETSPDCGGVCGATCSVLQAALVHRYRFDGTGSAIVDSVGGAHGVLVNASLSGSGSADLAGGASGQYVDLPNGIVSSLSDASFEAWITWNGGQGWQKIFDFGSSSAGEGNQSSFGQRFLTMSPKRALLDEALLIRHCPNTDCSNAGLWTEASTSTLAAGEEKHVVGVFDDAGDELRLYVDGIRGGAQPNTDSLSGLDDVNNWLGRSQYVGDPGFSGQLHEFRIYSRALSDAEVQYSYAAGPEPSFL